MSEILTFAKVYQYDMRMAGITVPVILKSGNETVECQAKLDTGSNNCIFRRQIGELLGIDIESGVFQEMGTVTGGFPTYGHEVSLSVLGVETTATVYFAADENFPRNFLGQQGWLDRVRLGLIDYDRLLYLSDYHDPG